MVGQGEPYRPGESHDRPKVNVNSQDTKKPGKPQICPDWRHQAPVPSSGDMSQTAKGESVSHLTKEGMPLGRDAV
jgi:hypothetical protein